MKPEIKKLWVDALRSGQYKQGRERLQQHGLFCCLGVLCDLAVKNGADVVVDRTVNGEILYDATAIYLPQSVSSWAGIADHSGEFQAEDGTTKWLSVLNDNGVPFPEIAATIEEYF